MLIAAEVGHVNGAPIWVAPINIPPFDIAVRTFSPSGVNRSAVRLARDRGDGTLRMHRLSFSAPARPLTAGGRVAVRVLCRHDQVRRRQRRRGPGAAWM